MNKSQAIRWLIDHRQRDVPLQDVIHHLKAALSFDPQAMALLHQITAEVNLARAPQDAGPAAATPPLAGLWAGGGPSWHRAGNGVAHRHARLD